MSNLEKFGARIKALKPAEVADDDVVKDRFIQLYNSIHGSDKGELVYHKEQFNYKKLLAETPTLRECSPLSLYGCFLDINVNGLSLQIGNNPDCYIIPKSIKVGVDTQGKDVWEKRAQLSISPYGEVKMRMRSGQIKYLDNPVIVYDCDKFRIGLNEIGKMVVKEYEATIPQPKEAKIIACFVRIERIDGSFEMPYLDMKDIDRLKGYSNKQNKGSETNDKSNALYTSFKGGIDPGFLAAKTIKHAFKTYPKVPTGQFSSLEPLEEVIPQQVNYGINAEDASANAPQIKDEFEEAITSHEVVEETAFQVAIEEEDNPFN